MFEPLLFGRYESYIRSLPDKPRYDRSELLVPELLIDREGDVEMYYAPHNEYITTSASIVIVGITPGWSQMERAYQAARLALAQNRPVEEACREAKLAARFAGTMRSNLVQMLDELGLHRCWGLPDSMALFEADGELLHTTSLLRYPVFVGGQNYTGHKPALAGHAKLHRFAYDSIVQELAALTDPLIIPLGKTVEAMFTQLWSENRVREEQVLWGFPHPSGANGHRHRQFAAVKEKLAHTVAEYAARYGLVESE